MNPEVFQALTRSLDEKTAGLDRLIALAEENRQALVAHDVDAIIRLNEEQTEELSRLDRLQRGSAKLLTRLGVALGVQEGRVSLSAIAAALPDEQRAALEQMSHVLTEKAGTLAEISETNAELSASALDFIRFTLNAVSESARQNNPGNNGSLVLDAQV